MGYADDFSAGFGIGKQVSDSFWSSFEKTRADMKDRVQRREAQERSVQLKKEVNDRFVYEEARLKGEAQAFEDRLLRNPKSVSPEERDIHDKRIFSKMAEIMQGKLDYLAPLMLDDNPYIAKVAEADAQGIVARFGDMQKMVSQSYVRAMEANEQKSKTGLQDAQTEQLGAETSTIPDKEARADRVVDIQEGGLAVDRVNADTAAIAESRLGRESLEDSARKDREEKAGLSDNWFKKKSLELDERRISLQSMQAKAEIIKETVGLDRNEREAIFKQAGMDLGAIEERAAGLSDAAKKALGEREQVLKRLQTRAEEGDDVKPGDMDFAKNQVMKFRRMVDELQLEQMRQMEVEEEVDERYEPAIGGASGKWNPLGAAINLLSEPFIRAELLREIKAEKASGK